YAIEVEHFFLALMDRADADLSPILRYFKVNRSRLADELNRSLESLKKGNDRTPVFSHTLLSTLTLAWTLGSINYGYSDVCTGMSLLALLTDPKLSQLIKSTSRELSLIKAETLRANFRDLTADSVETRQSAQPATSQRGDAPAADGKTPFLDQYTTN